MKPAKQAIILAASLFLAACNQSQPDAMTKSNQLTGKVNVNPTDNPYYGFKNADGAQQILFFYAGSKGWNENITSVNHYGFSASPIAKTIINNDLSYRLTLPDVTDASQLAPVGDLWQTDPFFSGSCTVSSAQFSDPKMRLSFGIFRMSITGQTIKRIDLGLKWEPNIGPSSRESISRGLIYADRAGTVTVLYDCTSSLNFRMASDTQLNLNAGWNVIEKRSLEYSEPSPTRPQYSYVTRSRPINSAGEDLWLIGETVWFDAP